MTIFDKVRNKYGHLKQSAFGRLIRVTSVQVHNYEQYGVPMHRTNIMLNIINMRDVRYIKKMVRRPISPRKFRVIRERLAVTSSDFADILQCHKRTIDNLEDGKSGISESLSLLMLLLDDCDDDELAKLGFKQVKSYPL